MGHNSFNNESDIIGPNNGTGDAVRFFEGETTLFTQLVEHGYLLHASAEPVDLHIPNSGGTRDLRVGMENLLEELEDKEVMRQTEDELESSYDEFRKELGL